LLTALVNASSNVLLDERTEAAREDTRLADALDAAFSAGLFGAKNTRGGSHRGQYADNQRTNGWRDSEESAEIRMA
jgi:hypothetical protein